MADSRLEWRKRKRYSNPKRQKPRHNGEEDEDDDDEDEGAAGQAAEEDEDHDSQAGKQAADPVLDLREAKALSDAGQRISDFPAAVRRFVNRPHSSIVALVAAELPTPLLLLLCFRQLESLGRSPS